MLKKSLQNDGINVNWDVSEGEDEDDIPLKRLKKKDVFDFPSDDGKIEKYCFFLNFLRDYKGRNIFDFPRGENKI